MANYAWVLEVRPGYEDEYRSKHDDMNEEMKQALRDSGIRNYNIFRHGLTLFGYFETDDLAASQGYLAKSEANKNWAEMMAPIMKIEIDSSTNFPFLLPLQFHLD